MQVTDSVTELQGVGTALQKRLRKLRIKTVGDLIHHYPRRYDDFSEIVPVNRATPGQVTVQGRIVHVHVRRTRRNFAITEAVLEDKTGSVKAVWFNQPYLVKQLRNLQGGHRKQSHPVTVYMSGRLEFRYNQYAFQNPVIERVSNFTKNTARIVPVYPETAGVSSKQLRSLIQQALPVIETVEEVLPTEVAKRAGLVRRAEALRQIHFPDSRQALAAARRRLGFEELFLLVLTGLVIKNEIQTETAIRIPFQEETAKQYVETLGFTLTDAQRRAAWRVLQDIDSRRTMNRLLEGDVGSGKTVVAGMAAAMAARSGVQTALMVPTEVLAQQHFQTLRPLLAKLDIRVELLTGGIRAAEREVIARRVREGTIDVLIGTHALLQQDISFHQLGLVVVDEQHRFGVQQREQLKYKAGRLPHLLSMTATPIPRSLALTVYGDLDISVIKELPPGRKPVKTSVATSAERETVYRHIEAEIKRGRQVYVVCPLVNDSDTLGVKSVEQETRRLKEGLFRRYRIEAIHGRMKPQEKQAVMDAFAAGDIDMLVSTTVIEVGVDVPNASVMLIEGAQRFGLATLHQLRGRVGRSQHQSYCYVMATAGQPAWRRLKLLEKYQNGFRLAQQDLELRGPGQIYGTRQHGLLDLRLADITDGALVSEARTAAQEFFSGQSDLLQYKQLMAHINKLKTVTTLD